MTKSIYVTNETTCMYMYYRYCNFKHSIFQGNIELMQSILLKDSISTVYIPLGRSRKAGCLQPLPHRGGSEQQSLWRLPSNLVLVQGCRRSPPDVFYQEHSRKQHKTIDYYPMVYFAYKHHTATGTATSQAFKGEGSFPT